MTVLLLAVEDARHRAVRQRFIELHPDTQVVFPVDGEADVATRMCAAINRLDPPAPLVIVAVGDAAVTLPAVGRSQAAHHRSVVEYLLIDPILPVVTDAWPTTRVSVVCDVDSESSLQARLRGWDLYEDDDLATWKPLAHD